MPTQIEVKRGDYGYTIVATLTEKRPATVEDETTLATGEIGVLPSDVSGAENIHVLWQPKDAATLQLGPCDPSFDDGYNQADWGKGIVCYRVQGGDFDVTAPGLVEVEVAGADWVYTWPNKGQVEVNVNDDLGGLSPA